MDEIVKRLQSLPKTRIICEGGFIASPHVHYGLDGLPFTSNIALWTTAAEDGVRSLGVVLDPKHDPLASTAETLGEFITACMGNQAACPHKLRVCCPKLAEYLFERLRHIGIEVQLNNTLPWWEAAVHRFVTELNNPPSLEDYRRMFNDEEPTSMIGVPTMRSSLTFRKLSEFEASEIESENLPV